MEEAERRRPRDDGWARVERALQKALAGPDSPDQDDDGDQ